MSERVVYLVRVDVMVGDEVVSTSGVHFDTEAEATSWAADSCRSDAGRHRRYSVIRLAESEPLAVFTREARLADVPPAQNPWPDCPPPRVKKAFPS